MKKHLKLRFLQIVLFLFCFSFCLTQAHAQYKKGDLADIFYNISLNSGRNVSGKLAFEDDSEIRLVTKSVGNITIPKSEIKNIQKGSLRNMLRNGIFWFTNASMDRYLFSHAQIQPLAQRVTLENTMLYGQGITYAPTNYWLLGATFDLPMLLDENSTTSYRLQTSFLLHHFPVAKWNLGLVAYYNKIGHGFDGYSSNTFTEYYNLLEGEELAGLVQFGKGNMHSNYTLGLGYAAFTNTYKDYANSIRHERDTNDALAQAAAQYRLFKNLSLVADVNYYVRNSAVRAGTGVRFLLPKLSLEAAYIYNDIDILPNESNHLFAATAVFMFNDLQRLAEFKPVEPK